MGLDEVSFLVLASFVFEFPLFHDDVALVYSLFDERFIGAVFLGGDALYCV